MSEDLAPTERREAPRFQSLAESSPRSAGAWPVALLKDCCSRLTVGFVGTCEPFFTGESQGVLLLRTGNLHGDRIVLSEVRYVTKQFHEANKKSRVRSGDILIARHGNFGNAVLVPTSIDDTNALNIVIVRTDPRVLLGAFAAYAINSDAVKSQVLGKAAGSTQVVINTGEIAALTVPVPSLNEQHAIAEALSDVDALLGELDRLIAKKRDLKQAVMQQLLTGQTRLAGFSEEWKVVRLGEIGKFLKGQGIRRDDVVEDGLPCVRYGEIYTLHNDHIRAFGSHITPTTAKQSQRIETGDLLFAGSGETAEEIGKCVAFLGDEEAYAGGDIVIFRPAAHSSAFLAYVMNHASVVAQKIAMAQGDAVVHISASSLARLEFALPPLNEQVAIANALVAFDIELVMLERRRGRTRSLKQGMMQELMSGRVRLV